MSNSNFPNVQTNPAGAIPIYETGLLAKNITTAASTQVKTGAGTFGRVTINTLGAGSTAIFYDGTSTAGVKLATVSTAAQTSLAFGVSFVIGLFVVTAGGTPADITVAYL